MALLLSKLSSFFSLSQLRTKEIINPILSPLGQLIEKEILDISTHHPEILIKFKEEPILFVEVVVGLDVVGYGFVKG